MYSAIYNAVPTSSNAVPNSRSSILLFIEESWETTFSVSEQTERSLADVSKKMQQQM